MDEDRSAGRHTRRYARATRTPGPLASQRALCLHRRRSQQHKERRKKGGECGARRLGVARVIAGPAGPASKEVRQQARRAARRAPASPGESDSRGERAACAWHRRAPPGWCPFPSLSVRALVLRAGARSCPRPSSHRAPGARERVWNPAGGAHRAFASVRTLRGALRWGLVPLPLHRALAGRAACEQHTRTRHPLVPPRLHAYMRAWPSACAARRPRIGSRATPALRPAPSVWQQQQQHHQPPQSQSSTPGLHAGSQRATCAHPRPTSERGRGPAAPRVLARRTSSYAVGPLAAMASDRLGAGAGPDDGHLSARNDVENSPTEA
ncbi:hypothetical protein CERSUDRAFT_100219 [Gelatoporia subvermispora B]|uniref:Uncharacterized protein n=1 Tax=Ceriporiopsis subvermispora (strain B) TaxID=914234 RepID=M2QYE1_CERS8|nr:hypothetical protein CERSUDRAFT_100219 [Gelatoporia subvermispora B]